MRRNKTLKMIEKECRGEVLDLGCGTGSVTRHLRDNGFSVEGCDVNESFLKIAKSNDSNSNYFFYDIEKGRIPKKYYTIILMGVLEGLSSPMWEVLEKLRSNLNSGGKIILEVPNVNSLNNRVRVLIGMDPKDDFENKNYRFTKKRLIWAIKKSSYKIEKLTTTKFVGFRYINIPVPDFLAEEFFVVLKNKESGR